MTNTCASTTELGRFSGGNPVFWSQHQIDGVCCLKRFSGQMRFAFQKGIQCLKLWNKTVDIKCQSCYRFGAEKSEKRPRLGRASWFLVAVSLYNGGWNRESGLALFTESKQTSYDVSVPCLYWPDNSEVIWVWWVGRSFLPCLGFSLVWKANCIWMCCFYLMPELLPLFFWCISRF